jgi:ATP-dependent Clp protease adaptor protein ClpS
MGNASAEVKAYMAPGTLEFTTPAMQYRQEAPAKSAAPGTSLHFCHLHREARMSQDDTVITPRTVIKPKVDKPKLYKVILFNDDYTPREFVEMVLQAVFRTGDAVAYRIMITAHQKGSCVVAVYARDIAETKVAEAMDYAKEAGFPLMFTAEPEE